MAKKPKLPDVKIGDEVTYVQMRHVPPIHEDRYEHNAVITYINEDGTVNLSLKNSEGALTVPISRVSHKSVAEEGMSFYVI